MSNFGVYPPNSGRTVRAQLKVLIADITLTNPGSFEAIPIPAGFDSLQIVASLRSTAATTSDGARFYVNGDTTDANYSTQHLQGTGTTATTVRSDNSFPGNMPGSSSTANDFGLITIDMPFHADTGRRRTFTTFASMRQDATNQIVRIFSINWESTEPITNVTIRTDNHATDLFAAGSRVQVFGLGTFAVALAR